jgi:hypothetical protein
MIVFNIGRATISVCEDTARCAVDNIQHDDVTLVANFCDKNNYVVDVIHGDITAAENLKYYTAGDILTCNDFLKKHIESQYC